VPQVEDAAAARAAVAFARFPPQGVRGYGSTTRAAAFGFKNRSAVRKQADCDLVIAVQIESKRGVENLDEILAVSGIDVVFIGTSDLSLSYGYDDPNHPEVVSLVGALIPRIRKAKKAAGIFLSDGRQIGALREQGVTYFTVAGTSLIKSALQDQVALFQRSITGRLRKPDDNDEPGQ